MTRFPGRSALRCPIQAFLTGLFLYYCQNQNRPKGRFLVYSLICVVSFDGVGWAHSAVLSEPPNPLQGLKRKGLIQSFIWDFRPVISGAVGVSNTCTKKIYPELAEAARGMRGNPTECEAIVWGRLSGRQLGHKFRRQHVIDRFIVDFFCLDRSLVVEIDGEVHDQDQGPGCRKGQDVENLGLSSGAFLESAGERRYRRGNRRHPSGI